MSVHGSHSPRERFFRLLEGKRRGRIPFFPDITDWYKARRTPPCHRQRYETGQIIYDDDPFHKENHDMPLEYYDWTLLDFYRNFAWGCPIHLYEWYEQESDGYQKRVEEVGRQMITTISTPIGEIRQVQMQAADGSLCIIDHFAKTTCDLEVFLWAAQHTSVRVCPDRIRKALDVLDEFGVIDIPVGRSPFGTFVHDMMGLENAVYALYEETYAVEKFLDAMEEPFLALVRAASQTPARIAIVSDHADEHLITPPFYEKYCLPIYREACHILHEAGKLVSTHVDGNIRSHFRLLPQTGIDLLDGCTPAPMSNFTVSELSDALGMKLFAYCGIPSALFMMNLPDDEILRWAAEIEEMGRGRMILNIGDVLSPEGNITQVIRVGEWAREVV